MKRYYFLILCMSLLVSFTPDSFAVEQSPCNSVLATELKENEELFSLYREFRPKRTFSQNDLHATQILSRIPFDQIPDDIRIEIKQKWLDVESDPAIITDSIKELKAGAFVCGSCAAQIRTHLGTFLGPHLFQKAIDRHNAGTPVPSRNLISRFRNRKEFNQLKEEHSAVVSYFDRNSQMYGEAILIYVRNILVGSIKLVSEDLGYSLLALRNVKDSFGRFVLIKGGIYHLPFKIMEKQILPAGFSKPRRRWIRMDFDTLNIKPNGFLLNWSSWDDWTIFPIASSEIYEEYLSIIKNKSEPIDAKSIESVRSNVWRNILQLLTDQRTRIELSEH